MILGRSMPVDPTNLSLSCFNHANAPQRRLKVFPVPVGDSKSAFSDC